MVELDEDQANTWYFKPKCVWYSVIEEGQDQQAFDILFDEKDIDINGKYFRLNDAQVKKLKDAGISVKRTNIFAIKDK